MSWADEEATDAWLATLHPAPPPRVTHEAVLEALDAVGEKPQTRHGYGLSGGLPAPSDD